MKLQAVRDLKESATLLTTKTSEVGIAHVIDCEDCSDFSKLCRITAYVIRFVSPVGSGCLNSEEMLFSESLWILES